MGGFLGIGGSSAKTDRGNQLAATQGEWNIFNASLPMSQEGQSTGKSTLEGAKGTLDTSLQTLKPAQDYFTSMLTAGRTQAMQQAAPAIQSVKAGEDAQRSQANNFGTGRTGGTAAANREASTTSGSTVDSIINSTLQTGKAAGAEGLRSVAGAQAGIGAAKGAIGGTELSNALSLLGISEKSVSSILGNATDSRGQSFDIAQKEGAAFGSLLIGLLGL